MKRVIGLVFLCGAASCVSAAAAPTSATPTASPAATATPKADVRSKPAARTQQVDISLLAPADEYFGPLKISIIGIRNTIRDAGLRYDVNHDTARATVSSAEMTERSIRDWETRYPRDDQLPRAVYLLQRLYTKVLLQEARDRARVTARWLLADFSASPQAKQLKKTLAVERLAPLPPPTPAPSAAPTYQSIFGSPYPSQFNGDAGPSPAPSPAPSGQAGYAPLGHGATPSPARVQSEPQK